TAEVTGSMITMPPLTSRGEIGVPLAISSSSSLHSRTLRLAGLARLGGFRHFHNLIRFVWSHIGPGDSIDLVEIVAAALARVVLAGRVSDGVRGVPFAVIAQPGFGGHIREVVDHLLWFYARGARQRVV